MLIAFQVLTVAVVAVAMALSVAHALEFPGKRRLSKEHYLAVQKIYFPGFTVGGFSEPLGLVATLVLTFVFPESSAERWLTGAAFLCLCTMQLVYWLMTHPVNNFWLKDVDLKGRAAGFFSFAAPQHSDRDADWTALRDRWEMSHVVRAILGAIGLILLASAVAI